MKLTASRPVSAAERERARSRLAAVAAWARWVPGLQSATPQGTAVRWVFAPPMARTALVAITVGEDGAAWELIEGEFRALGGSLIFGDEIVLEARLDAGLVLPGPLVRELEDVYPARLLAALCSP